LRFAVMHKRRMVIEAVVAVASGVAAGSVVLLAFNCRGAGRGF
jgi:hypothetical protein